MVEKVFVRSPYNYDRDRVSDETGLACLDESKTQQHQKDDADINTIVRRFGLTGELPQTLRVPQYGDFSDIRDYQTALHAVMQANEAFMMLPAEVRSKFENDPEQFVEFCLDPANHDEAVKLGLAVKKEPAEPLRAMPDGGAGGKEDVKDTPKEPAKQA